MGSGEAQRERGRGRLGDPNRQAVRDESYVSPWIKWLMFSFNMLFWLISWGLIAIGAWAYIETQSLYGNQETDDFFDVIFDVSIVFIFLGCVVFVLAFFGAIGALRENICLLKTFAILLLILFIAEIALVIACFAFAGPIKEKLGKALREEAIRDYRDDINRNNIIDWFQETFECCGVGGSDGDGGYTEWEKNKYFNCSSPGFEACSVPYSCCKNPYTFDSEVINTRCGADALKKSRVEASETIYVTGCLDAALQKAEDNMFIIGGVALGIVIPQLIGIFLAKVLAGQISDQKARWGNP